MAAARPGTLLAILACAVALSLVWVVSLVVASSAQGRAPSTGPAAARGAFFEGGGGGGVAARFDPAVEQPARGGRAPEREREVAATGADETDRGRARGAPAAPDTTAAAAAAAAVPAAAAGPPARVYFFAIFTTPLAFRRRSIIRRTWLHCLAQDAGAGSGANCLELRYRFFIGRASADVRRQAARSGAFGRLAREMGRHGDVVPLLVEDRYENLTLKSQLALQWVAREWAAASGDPLVAAPRVAPPAAVRAPASWGDDATAAMLALASWADHAPVRFGGAARELEALDEELLQGLALGPAAGPAAGSAASLLAPRPWGAPFAGLPFATRAAGSAAGGGAVLEYLVKVDADVHFCPSGHLFRYGAALLAPRDQLEWRVRDLPPVLTQQQAATLYSPGRRPRYLWVGRGPYGNKSVIRDVKNYFHIPHPVYPGRVDPPFLPGPTYMLTGDLLLALAGTFPVAPQAVLDGWRGFEDKFLGMLVEQARVVRGLPVHVEGRDEHYLDAATPDKVRRPFCDAGWVTKLAVQVIGYNESLPLTQFQCPGWAWPLADESYD